MPNDLRQFATLIISSSGSLVSNALQGCSDIGDLTIIVTSSVTGTVWNVQVSLFDPTIPVGQQTISSGFYTLQQPLSTPFAILPGQALAISAVAFHQVRLLGTGAETSGTTVGYAAKSVAV